MTGSVVTALAWAAVLLTAAGSYRLASYFYRRDPLYAILAALTLTLLFVAFLDVLLLATGLLVVLAPIRHVLSETAVDGGFPGRVPGPPRVRLHGLRDRVRHGVARVGEWLDSLRRDEPGHDRRRRRGLDRRPHSCPRCLLEVDYGQRACPNCGLQFRWRGEPQR